jgi:hypothetical protein
LNANLVKIKRAEASIWAKGNEMIEVQSFVASVRQAARFVRIGDFRSLKMYSIENNITEQSTARSVKITLIEGHQIRVAAIVNKNTNQIKMSLLSTHCHSLRQEGTTRRRWC